MSLQLRDYQLDAVKRLRNGSILCGGVGSGKSITALAYFYISNGGSWDFLKGGAYKPTSDPTKDLYIITTAMKRDSKEWEKDMGYFLMSTSKDLNVEFNNVVVDSWNNVRKYDDKVGAFFIFDEQRVVGYGAWVKAFLKIARGNDWILLSATPGDTWTDYIPVFIANGFYKNKTEFVNGHVVYDPRVKFPKIKRYLNTGRLIRLRDRILVDMDFDRKTTAHHSDIYCSFDIPTYKDTMKRRWNPYRNEPIQNAGELCYILRRIVNSDESRQAALLELFEKHPKMIIFYNFDYELDILKGVYYGDDVEVAEWNGHAHQPVPKCDSWVYLVQYTAGCEGWNCITTDTIVFYSQNYSYRVTQQASGRIDRLNTPYFDLYYYHLKSHSSIDLAIAKTLKQKKNFNEGRFIKW